MTEVGNEVVTEPHAGTVLVTTLGCLAHVNNNRTDKELWALPVSFLLCGHHQAGQSKDRCRLQWLLEQASKGPEDKE